MCLAAVHGFAPHRARFLGKRWCRRFVWCRREPKLVLRGALGSYRDLAMAGGAAHSAGMPALAWSTTYDAPQVTIIRAKEKGGLAVAYRSLE